MYEYDSTSQGCYAVVSFLMSGSRLLYILAVLSILVNSCNSGRFSPLLFNSAIQPLQDGEFLMPLAPYTSTGTTIVGVCCIDGVVLGADTRSTGGSIVMDKGKFKIRRISTSIYCCGAGVSADCDQITRKASHDLLLMDIDDDIAGSCGSGSEASGAAKSIANSLKITRLRAPEAVFILGGVDRWGPRLFQIGVEGVPIRVPFGSLGSGSPNALAVLEKVYHDIICQTMSCDESEGFLSISVASGIEIVRKAILAGIVNDLGSGSHVDLCVIRRNSVNQWREHHKH